MRCAAAFLLMVAVSAQVTSARLTLSQRAGALVFSRTRNPYLKAMAFNLLRRRPQPNPPSASVVRPSARTRTCPEEIRDSFYKYCNSSFCSNQQTINSCCMVTTTGSTEATRQDCRCEPTITCSSGEQASQGQGQDQTEPRSLCGDTDPQFRSLGSTPVQGEDRCRFGEVANLTLTSDNGPVVICNAVLTRANVGGVTKTTFVTSALCTRVVEQSTGDDGLVMRIGSQTFSLTEPFTTLEGPNGAAFIDVPQASMSVLGGLGQCETPSCAYDSDTMEGQVTMDDCKMVSYGAADEDDLTFTGMRELDLEENPGGCTDLPDLFDAADTMCFQSRSGEASFCVGDSGAPVYCRAPSTDEWILIGVASLQTGCGESSEVKVIRTPV